MCAYAGLSALLDDPQDVARTYRPQQQPASAVSESKARVRMNSQRGFIETVQKMLAPATPEQPSAFENVFFQANDDGTWKDV